MELSQIAVMNTDPLRVFDSFDPDTLPESACQPEVRHVDARQFDYYVRQYYLAPNMDPSQGPKWYEAAAQPLWRLRP